MQFTREKTAKLESDGIGRNSDDTPTSIGSFRYCRLACKRILNCSTLSFHAQFLAIFIDYLCTKYTETKISRKTSRYFACKQIIICVCVFNRLNDILIHEFLK